MYTTFHIMWSTKIKMCYCSDNLNGVCELSLSYCLGSQLEVDFMSFLFKHRTFAQTYKK